MSRAAKIMSPVFLEKQIETFSENARQVLRDELLLDGVHELPFRRNVQVVQQPFVLFPQSPLHMTQVRGNVALVDQLLEKKADNYNRVLESPPVADAPALLRRRVSR